MGWLLGPDGVASCVKYPGCAFPQIWDVGVLGFFHMNCEHQLENQVQCLCLNIIPSPRLVLDLFISGAFIGDVSCTGDGIKPRTYLDLTHTQDHRKMGI